MKRDALNEDDYDEVCRVIGDAVVVLAESGHETKREEISALLGKADSARWLTISFTGDRKWIA